MPVKAWVLRSARLQCPHCHKTVYMQYKGRWSIRKAYSEKDSPTTQSPSLSLPDKDEGEEHDDGA